MSLCCFTVDRPLNVSLAILIAKNEPHPPEISSTASSEGVKRSVSLAVIAASMSEGCEAVVDSDRRTGGADLDVASRFASDENMT